MSPIYKHKDVPRCAVGSASVSYISIKILNKYYKLDQVIYKFNKIITHCVYPPNSTKINIITPIKILKKKSIYNSILKESAFL